MNKAFIRFNSTGKLTHVHFRGLSPVALGFRNQQLQVDYLLAKRAGKSDTGFDNALYTYEFNGVVAGGIDAFPWRAPGQMAAWLNIDLQSYPQLPAVDEMLLQSAQNVLREDYNIHTYVKGAGVFTQEYPLYDQIAFSATAIEEGITKYGIAMNLKPLAMEPGETSVVDMRPGVEVLFPRVARQYADQVAAALVLEVEHKDGHEVEQLRQEALARAWDDYS